MYSDLTQQYAVSSRHAEADRRRGGWGLAISPSLKRTAGLLVLGLLSSASAQTTSPAHLFHQRSIQARTDQVPESSGVIASRINPDIYWTHNDSGRYSPRVYAFRLTAADIESGVAPDHGYVELQGARLKDWEDIAYGPDNRIYIMDGGDNPPCKRDGKRIYRFAEPKVDKGIHPLALHVPCEAIRFEYPSTTDASRPAMTPEERFDAECLLVHPDSGDIYIVTKQDTNKTPTARVYKLSAADLDWNSEKIHVLQWVTDISRPLRLTSYFLTAVTGGDVSRDGRRVVIRNYLAAYEFTLPPNRPFEEVFRQLPRFISLLGEPQGEGICYTIDGRKLITTSEVKHLGEQSFRIYVTPAEPPAASDTQPEPSR
ncbi:MAG: hypothetical protein GXY44_04270 [Phycisphaerales bacterium]|nr:hypothetical protein [Phycisphaerales bacterium]